MEEVKLQTKKTCFTTHITRLTSLKCKDLLQNNTSNSLENWKKDMNSQKNKIKIGFKCE